MDNASSIVGRTRGRQAGMPVLRNTYGRAGFLSGGTARGMSPSSTGICAFCGCSFGALPRSEGGSLGVGILTVAIGSVRRRIAPPLLTGNEHVVAADNRD